VLESPLNLVSGFRDFATLLIDIVLDKRGNRGIPFLRFVYHIFVLLIDWCKDTIFFEYASGLSFHKACGGERMIKMKEKRNSALTSRLPIQMGLLS
jgi:hypothetical protein